MRRMLVVIGIILLLTAGFAALNWTKLSVLPNPWGKLTVLPIRGGAYWIRGGVSNTGFVVGEHGVIVIDPQMFQTTARTALAEIGRVTTKPVRHLIVTHADPDHINGLPAYAAGIEIIAQENSRRRMVAALANSSWSLSSPSPSLRYHLPTRIVGDAATLDLEGVRVRLLHVGPAHTDGDLIVFLPRQRIVYAGDILTPAVGPYPGLHLEHGGSSLGWIKFVETMLKLDADIFVSGHGEPLTAPEVKMRLDLAVRRRAEIGTLVRRGMTLDQIKAVLRDPKPAGVAALFPTFTENTYRELGGK